MTGLEKIINHINEDSQLQVKGIIDNANAEAEKIISDAKAEAEKISHDIAEKSDRDVKSLIERAESTAAIEIRRNVLCKKQELIAEIINEAKAKLTGLPDKEYFQVVSKLIEKYSLNENGSILLSGKDIDRLPEDFDLKGLVLSKEPHDFSGGFILVYGDIEINCTFDALFEGAHEELSDIVNNIVFEGV